MTWSGESGPSNSGLMQFTSDGSPNELTGAPSEVLLWNNGTPKFMPQNSISGSEPTSINQIGDVNTSGLVAGQVLKWDGSNWTPSSDIAGSGSVNSAAPPTTDNAIVRWNGTTGDMIQDSNVIVDDGNNVNVPSGSVYKINGVPLVIDHLADVSTSGVDAPSINEFLGWDGSRWRPATPQGQGGPRCYIAAASGNVTTSSITFVDVPGMTHTPASGSYYCIFGATGSMNKNSQNVIAIININGVDQLTSQRELGGQSNNRGNFNCNVPATVNGSQVIKVRWRITNNAGGGTGTIFERTFALLECSPQ